MNRPESGKIRQNVRRGVAFAEAFARRRPLGFAVLLVTLCFTAVIWLMPPAFQTNDDAVMCMIASGQGIALSPDEHLVFTNALIGKILKTLYTEAPAFHWYGWYLVATQWSATVALLYCLLRPRYTRLSMLGFGAYFLTAGIYFLVNLQFTATGTLAGITGGLLLVQLLRYPWQSRLEQAILALGGALLLVWGGLIRSDIFPLTFIILCPVLLTVYWASSAGRGAAVRVGLSISLAVGAMFLAGRYHEACYSDPAWVEFYQYNPLRIKFNDELWIQYLPENKHVFEQVGWSKVDYEMICAWYYDDPQYDREKLNTILTSYSWAYERSLTKTLRALFKEMIRQPAFLAILFVMPGMLLFLNRRQRRFWPFVVALLSAWGIVLAVTVFRKAAPERVYMPVLTFPWLVVLFSLAPGWRHASSSRGLISRLKAEIRTAWLVRNWSWLKPGAARHLALRTISLLVVIGLVMSVRKQIRIGKDHTRQLVQYQKTLDEMRPATNEHERLVLTFGADFPYEHQAVLFGENNYAGLRFFSVGWPQRTPIAERMKQHFEIKNLGQAMATNPHLKLVIRANEYIRVIDYLAEHYSTALRIVNEKDFNRFALSSINKSEPANVSETAAETSIWLAFPTLKRLGFIR